MYLEEDEDLLWSFCLTFFSDITEIRKKESLIFGDMLFSVRKTQDKFCFSTLIERCLVVSLGGAQHNMCESTRIGSFTSVSSDLYPRAVHL